MPYIEKYFEDLRYTETSQLISLAIQLDGFSQYDFYHHDIV